MIFFGVGSHRDPGRLSSLLLCTVHDTCADLILLFVTGRGGSSYTEHSAECQGSAQGAGQMRGRCHSARGGSGGRKIRPRERESHHCEARLVLRQILLLRVTASPLEPIGNQVAVCHS